MNNENTSGILGIVCILLFVAYVFYPTETVEEKKDEIATITNHISRIGGHEPPKPYFMAKLNNALNIKIQDYGQFKLNIGDKVIVKKYKGKITKINTYVLIGKQ